MKPGPEVIRLFSCSTEHELCLANKSQITNNCKFFLAKNSPIIFGIFIDSS